MKFSNPDPKDRGWRGAPLHWQIAHVIGIALPALVFWFAPDDVLTRYPVLATITGVLKEWIPSVRNMAEFSTFPQVAELGMSAIFVCAIFLIPVFHYGKTVVKSRRDGYKFPTEGKQKRLVYFLAVVIGPMAIAGLLLLGPDNHAEAVELLRHQGDRISRISQGVFLDSRAGSGIVASIYAAAIAGFIVGIEIRLLLHLMDKRKESDHG